MILHPSQQEVARDTHRFRVLNMGRRWGKTTLAIEEIKGVAVFKQSRICYVAPTYQQSRDIAWQSLLKELQPIIKKINESRLELEVHNKLGNTSLIQLRGWESIETLRGQSFDFLVLDEVAMMRNFWLHWQEVIRPTLTDRKGHAMFISTPKGFNHFYELYNFESKDEDYKSFHFTSYDNPTIPAEEIDKAKLEITEDRFAQEYLGDFRKTEGLVYKEFDRTRHIFEEAPAQFTEIILGVDFGYTNPATVLRIGKDFDNNFWITDEWYKTKQTTEQITEIALSYKPNKVYPDPAEPDRIETLKRAGLNCMEVSKDIPAGIDKVRDLFKQNRIRIHSSCYNLIWELETYRYPDKKPEQNEREVPIKENDHACLVGNTKIAMADGSSKRLKDVKIGDRVKTKTGSRLVTDSALTRKNADIIEIELSNGSTIKGTGSHKVITANGYTRLDALSYDDKIEVIDTKLSLWKKQLSLTAISTIGMVNIIAQLADIKTAGKGFIKQYGSSTTEELKKATTSITLTAIEPIIQSTILNLKKQQSICLSIGRRITKDRNLKVKLLNILKRLEVLQASGTEAMRVLYGTASTAKKAGIIENRLFVFAKFAEEAMLQCLQIDQDIAIRIVGRRRLGQEDVYNITVDTDHHYYANGLLVKNCDALRYALYSNQPTIEADEDFNIYATNYN